MDIVSDYREIEAMAKRLAVGQWREAISELYITIHKKGIKPDKKWIYWFFKNITKVNSPLNYKPIAFRGDEINEDLGGTWEQFNEVDIEIDTGSKEIVDFLINHENKDKWIKIWNIVYKKDIKLDLFEKILFEYIFIQGLSIRDIVKITGNSQNYIYEQRRALISKIKKEINE